MEEFGEAFGGKGDGRVGATGVDAITQGDVGVQGGSELGYSFHTKPRVSAVSGMSSCGAVGSGVDMVKSST